jgi:hypothetical protein
MLSKIGSKYTNLINEEYIKDEDSQILKLGINVLRSISDEDACTFVCQIVGLIVCVGVIRNRHVRK